MKKLRKKSSTEVFRLNSEPDSSHCTTLDTESGTHSLHANGLFENHASRSVSQRNGARDATGLRTLAGAITDRIRHSQAVRFATLYNLRFIWHQMSVMRHDNFVGVCNQTPVSRSVECKHRRYISVFAGFLECPLFGCNGRGETRSVGTFFFDSYGVGHNL